MSFFSQTKSKKEQIVEQRRRRRGEGPLPAAQRFNGWQVLLVGLFLAVAGVVTFLCFVGASSRKQELAVGERVRVRVVNDKDFSYVSQLQTGHARAVAQDQVAPSYKLDTSPEDRLRKAVLALETGLEQYKLEAPTLSAEELKTARDDLVHGLSEDQQLALDPRDIVSLTENVTTAQRNEAFKEGLMAVSGLLKRGIFDSNQPGFQASGSNGVLYNLDIPGRLSAFALVSQEEALRELNIELSPLEVSGEVKAAIYRVLKQALTPNIHKDDERSKRDRDAAANRVKPVLVQMHAGDVIVDPDMPVTGEQKERFEAYQQVMAQSGDLNNDPAAGLVQRFLFVTLLLAAAVIFVKSGLKQLEQSPKLYALATVLVLLNLGLLRLVLMFGESNLVSQRPGLVNVLDWIAPTMLAPLMIAVMIGAAPAALAALLISVLFSMMTGDTLEVFIVNFLASLVAIHFCRDVRVRARLVRAGLLGGLAAAVCAAYLGFLDLTPAITVSRQMFAAAFTGLLTAVAALGLLPLFENLFKITTDITLLELTDFNHPLLRKLQMAAPGSYHHSLMVANLAERAAAEIGANALLSRACSLYHDIGKMAKPEYFNENQREGFNPHEEMNPSMSALIIKSHVKEGLDLARQYKLPKVIQDVISQHHGTTLIKFFYRKAAQHQRLVTQHPFPKTRASRPTTPSPMPEGPAPGRDEPGLDESFYRYDGPKPNFKESAIIALADCIEAASRSLRKVTPQSVEELIESLFNDRVEDHQFDESPITIQELTRIKQSFNITLLNMLHSRVQYPGSQSESTGNPDSPKASPAAHATSPAPSPAPLPPGKTVPAAPEPTRSATA